MSTVCLKRQRNNRIVRAMRQEWRGADASADRNLAAAARWDRVLLRRLALVAKEAA